MHTSVCVSMHVCLYGGCVCTCISTWVCFYVCMYLYIYLSMYICLYVCTIMEFGYCDEIPILLEFYYFSNSGVQLVSKILLLLNSVISIIPLFLEFHYFQKCKISENNILDFQKWWEYMEISYFRKSGNSRIKLFPETQNFSITRMSGIPDFCDFSYKITLLKWEFIISANYFQFPITHNGIMCNGKHYELCLHNRKKWNSIILC